MSGPADPAARWVALREAVREANALGAKLRIVGAAVEIEGDLPASLIARLPQNLLFDYLGAGAADAAEIAFVADQLQIEVVLVEGPAGYAEAILALTDAGSIAIDLETAPPD